MPIGHIRASALSGIFLLFMSAALASPAQAQASPTQQVFSPQELRQDLAFMETSLRSTHPDLGHSANVAQLDRQFRRIDLALDHPLTLGQAWMAFGTLNPILADGHLGVSFPNWSSSTEKHLGAGGVLFPFEVIVSPSGQLRIRSNLGGSPSALAGRRILAINGHSAETISKSLLARMYGDTALSRAGLLSNRWWFFFWQTHGAPKSFDLTVSGPTPQHIRVAGSHAQPRYLAYHSSFDQAFQFRRLGKHVAILTVNTFYWSDKARFFDFTQQAFSTIAKSDIATLIIDIRQNGGGDDDMWIKGILPYIATKPYRWASGYAKKVIPHHQDPGQKIGDVVHGTIDHWIQPDNHNPLRFSGKLYVVAGSQTYSSAVLFANVVQDFGFGRIAGQGGVVRAAQSGGVQSFTLPNTGLEAFSPRFILTRPSGAAKPEFVQPDLPLRARPLQPEAMITELLMKISTGLKSADWTGNPTQIHAAAPRQP